MNFSRISPSLPSQRADQSGQIAVIILLVVVVLATMGLSELTQTTEDLFISSQKEESTRVFNAAETGIEEGLSDESRFGSTAQSLPEFTEDDTTSVNVNITPETTLETRIAEGETATVNLTGGTNARIDFGSTPTCDAASLMIAIYSQVGANPMQVRYHYVKPASCTDDTTTPTRNNDTFVAAGGITGTYRNRYANSSLGLTSDDRLMRITALYSPTTVLVAGLSSSVPQAHTVRSTAETDVSGQDGAENTIEQIISVQRTVPAAPSFMNYVLYSNGAIQH